MIHGNKVVVVMPAYNAEKTLELTVNEIPKDFVDEIVLVDDASSDNTSILSEHLGLHTLVHPNNRGYGGNQKSCYKYALNLGADVIIMLHPDYQYTPKLLTAMASMIAVGEFDAVIGSRILGGDAIRGGMPVYKYLANRILTIIQNILQRAKLSEYHSGYRAFSKEVLINLPLEENSDDFIFDNQMLAQILYFGYSIGEITCPTKYFDDASSINLSRSIKYGLGVIKVSIQFLFQKLKIKNSIIFSLNGEKISIADENQ